MSARFKRGLSVATGIGQDLPSDVPQAPPPAPEAQLSS